MVVVADYIVPQIVFLGDSITQYSSNFTNGIVPRLQNEFQRQFDVVNRGFSGYNTKWISEIADPIYNGISGFLAPIEYSIIFLGSNDAANNTLQHVDIDDFALNLENIIEVSNAYSNNTIVVGPAVVNEDLWADRSNVDFYEYSEVAKAVAAENNVTFVDLFSAFRKFFNETADFSEAFIGDFNATAIALNATANSTANSTVDTPASGFTLFSKRGSPGLGFIANGNTTLNDTIVAVNATKYPKNESAYIGQKGNRKNALLSQVLIDGLHFNNRGYDIFYKALKPAFNITKPYYPLPYYKDINSTEYLVNYLEKGYLAAQFSLNNTAAGSYSYDIYNLTNLTIANTTYGNISFNNYTASFPSYKGNLTNVVLDSLDINYPEVKQSN